MFNLINNQFKVVSSFKPDGDQPVAIEKLAEGVKKNLKHQILLGVTGSGKTFTIANVIEKVQKPTLILAPNKTLAAQLCAEFREFFPHNAVEYFVSYYDYYQPEAYVPSKDLYIEKDSSINEEIDRLRHSATHSILTRRDTIVVASVSCIYGLGLPEEYFKGHIFLKKGLKMDRDALIQKLISVQYQRNDVEQGRGLFRVKGDVVDIMPSYERHLVRVSFFGDEIESLSEIHPVTGKIIHKTDNVSIYPATHYVTSPDRMEQAFENIEQEMKYQVEKFTAQNKLIEAQRIEQRTKFDMEMMKELGYCSGIENYSRHLDGRMPGDPPGTLIDFFPKDFLMVIDESHIAVPQIGGMYGGDRSRKQSLVDYGFRLPSALDNRPLSFKEFEGKVNQLIYVSATPGPYELQKSKEEGNEIVEQIIRPTRLVDPQISIRPMKNQIEDLMSEIKGRINKNERVLVTTLTKKMAENLNEYLIKNQVKTAYIHSDVATLDRLDILRDLRLGKYDVLVGINLLREGLDLPEVSLVAIMDADKEGFLRADRSLIQMFGRAARNSEGLVILYADNITGSMERAISETNRRRKIQQDYNTKHGYTPETIIKAVKDLRNRDKDQSLVKLTNKLKKVKPEDMPSVLADLQKQMQEASENLEFEKAIIIRDQISKIEKEMGIQLDKDF
jgi:excinuclease ABC subunit B